MTTFNMKEFYARQVEYYRHEIEFDTQNIEWETRNIQREKEGIRNLAEYVWSKGPLTKTDMKIWGDKNYKTPEQRESEKRRKKYYRERKKDTEELERYTRLLEKM